MSRRKLKPSRPPSKLVPAILGAGIIATGFVTLIVRLEVVREGYRLSTLRSEIAEFEENNRRLKLEAARLSSHQRLRSLAAKYQMFPPARGQVVVMP